jgi:hypothetical protein
MNNDVKDMITSFLAVLVALIITFGGSWVIFNFILWLICMCFHFTFDFLIGTGLWLFCLLLRFVLKAAKN